MVFDNNSLYRALEVKSRCIYVAKMCEVWYRLRSAVEDSFAVRFVFARACACLAEHAGFPETSEASFGG